MKIDPITWPRTLANAIAEARMDEDTGVEPHVDFDPLERDGAYVFRVAGLAGVVVTVAYAGTSCFATFQPEIPREATQFKTQPPVKTRPFNEDRDLDALAEAISMFAGTEFLEWQGTVIMESAKATHWNGFSAALLDAVAREPWAPSVSMDDAGVVTMRRSKLTIKASADGLAIKWTGKPETYLDLLRGLFKRGNEE